MKTLCVSRLAIGLIALATLAPVQAQDRIQIRMGTLAQKGTPWHDILLQMKEDWRIISNGRVTIKIYSGVLGDEVEMIRKMRIRQLQAVAVSGAALPHIEPATSCLQIPLMLESYEELDFVRDRIAPRLEKRIEGKGDFKVLNWSDAGWVHFFTKRPASTPNDIRGLKLLTSAGDPDTEKLYKDFGLTVVPLPYTEVLMALETGMIEAVQGPPLYALVDQWFGLANNMTDFKWTPLVAATVIRKDTWDKIPAVWHARMLESSRAAGLLLRARIRQLNEEAVPEMVKRGLNVVTLNERTIDLWRSEAERAYPKLRGKYVSADFFDEVLRLRDEFRATQN